jgi:hypothetical protein
MWPIGSIILAVAYYRFLYCHMTNGPSGCLGYDYPEPENQETSLWQEFQFQKGSCYLILTEKRLTFLHRSGYILGPAPHFV